ncbi:serine/threonine protein phosphatase [Superficieibacter electus]|uniref:Serine/threonine protein phosphatase n=1 Tax=Superficieibacter electus TaxID=2022662 RepID=A0A2P5GTQ8_9ENTR|nr:protein-serine/threonine phosphatase [Superficieibacter electus]POP46464.1 serine/threonine protein phosphatase [Superficieibacter electus]POP49932.1 serine/threonine protein phosphatase [Superficieibacter electus]
MSSVRYHKINSSDWQHIWVVGDIHGCYSLLQSRLTEIGFCREKDLLISVGDNIDRGPENMDVLRLLNEPWFISVMGNHEAMALDAFATQDGNMWLGNGGAWFFKLTQEEQQEAIALLLRFHSLPHIIEIDTARGKQVIAHADYPGDSYRFNKAVDINIVLWSVERVLQSLENRTRRIAGADTFIFGHMIFDHVQTFANQVYIDIGSSTSGKLAFYQLQ